LPQQICPAHARLFDRVRDAREKQDASRAQWCQPAGEILRFFTYGPVKKHIPVPDAGWRKTEFFTSLLSHHKL